MNLCSSGGFTFGKIVEIEFSCHLLGRLQRNDHRFGSRRAAFFGKAVDRNERISSRKICRGAVLWYLIWNGNEALKVTFSIVKMACYVHDLSGVDIELAHVFAIKENDTSAAFDAAIAIFLTVNSRVELAMSADRRHQQAPFWQIDLVESARAKGRLSLVCWKVSCMRFIWQIESALLPNSFIVVFAADHS